MKYFKLSNTDLTVPQIIMGCMRINALTNAEIDRLFKTALDEGVSFFDHADIYGKQTCEQRFSDAVSMNDDLREKIILQTKCGIRSGFYDFSKEHIIRSAEQSLRRLKTDYLDILLLHRPDALAEPEEVAEAFNILQAQGKVRHFGVSNHTPMQIELLQRRLSQKLIVNQVQFSAAHTLILDSGIAFNMLNSQAVNRDGGVLDYCRLNSVGLQAWSPFQAGFFRGPFVGDRDNHYRLNETLDALAEKYGVTPTTIAAAFITRHPANIQVVTGTTKPERFSEICRATDIALSREDWYAIYKASGKMIP